MDSDDEGSKATSAAPKRPDMSFTAPLIASVQEIEERERRARREKAE